MKTSRRKFLLMNSKKILGIIAVLMVMVSAFSVLSFAANSDKATATDVKKAAEQSVETIGAITKLKTLVNVKIISSVDTESGTAFIPNSDINIYKVSSSSDLKESNIKGKNLFAKAKTGDKGEVDIAMEPGYYIIDEQDFELDGVKYDADIMYLEVSGKAQSLTVYLKHTVIDETPQTTQKPSNIPFTGTSLAVTAVAASSMMCAAFVVLVLSKRREKGADAE